MDILLASARPGGETMGGKIWPARTQPFLLLAHSLRPTPHPQSRRRLVRYCNGNLRWSLPVGGMDSRPGEPGEGQAALRSILVSQVNHHENQSHRQKAAKWFLHHGACSHHSLAARFWLRSKPGHAVGEL